MTFGSSTSLPIPGYQRRRPTARVPLNHWTRPNTRTLWYLVPAMPTSPPSLVTAYSSSAVKTFSTFGLTTCAFSTSSRNSGYYDRIIPDTVAPIAASPSLLACVYGILNKMRHVTIFRRPLVHPAQGLWAIKPGNPCKVSPHPTASFTFLIPCRQHGKTPATSSCTVIIT